MNILRQVNKWSFWQVYLVSCLLLIPVVLLRFNQTGIFNLFEFSANDSQFYEAIVIYFRSGEITGNFIPPFNYRPVLPFLASVLPFGPLTSLNLINIAAMLGSLYFLQRIVQLYGFNSSSWLLIANLLFIFAFPTFYYGTIGLIEPLLIFTLFLAIYLALKEKFLLCILLFLPGILVKEVFILFWPILLAILYKKEKPAKQIVLIGVAALAVALIATYIGRNWILTDGTYFWEWHWWLFKNNISRPKTWLSGLLTLGIPGIIAIYAAIRLGKRFVAGYLPLYLGLLLSLMLYVYSMLSAFSDGRFIWLSYPFTIPLALLAIKYLAQQKKSD